jgi:hypothetical protein
MRLSHLESAADEAQHAVAIGTDLRHHCRGIAFVVPQLCRRQHALRTVRSGHLECLPRIVHPDTCLSDNRIEFTTACAAAVETEMVGEGGKQRMVNVIWQLS